MLLLPRRFGKPGVNPQGWGRGNFQALGVGKARWRCWDAGELRSCGAAALRWPPLSCSPNPHFCTCLPLGPLRKKIPSTVLLFCWTGRRTFSFLFLVGSRLKECVSGVQPGFVCKGTSSCEPLSSASPTVSNTRPHLFFQLDQMLYKKK